MYVSLTKLIKNTYESVGEICGFEDIFQQVKVRCSSTFLALKSVTYIAYVSKLFYFILKYCPI